MPGLSQNYRPGHLVVLNPEAAEDVTRQCEEAGIPPEDMEIYPIPDREGIYMRGKFELWLQRSNFTWDSKNGTLIFEYHPKPNEEGNTPDSVIFEVHEDAVRRIHRTGDWG